MDVQRPVVAVVTSGCHDVSDRGRWAERSRRLPDMGVQGPRSGPPSTRHAHPPAEGLMSAMVVPVPIPVDHNWELRLEEFEDGQVVRRFECVECGAVRFE